MGWVILSKQLDEALQALRAISTSDDMRWLVEYVRERQGNRPRLHGILGGYEGYAVDEVLAVARDYAANLDKGELRTFGIVVDLLHDLLRPKAGGTLGQVDL